MVGNGTNRPPDGRIAQRPQQRFNLRVQHARNVPTEPIPQVVESQSERELRVEVVGGFALIAIGVNIPWRHMAA